MIAIADRTGWSALGLLSGASKRLRTLALRASFHPMDRMGKAVAIATEYLSERLSPLQAASRMHGLNLVSLPCWEGTGGVHGPLSAIYGAADKADERHFLGDDVERWHAHVREQERAELAAAEADWRGRIDHACRTLIEYAVAH